MRGGAPTRSLGRRVLGTRDMVDSEKVWMRGLSEEHNFSASLIPPELLQLLNSWTPS
jgi:hypothetical protein